MGTLTIRDLDDAVKDRLRVQAATNGRSMEAEARAILAAAVQGGPASDTGLRTPPRSSVRIARPATRRDLPRIPRASGGPTSMEILDDLRSERLGPGQ
jgi:phosphopantothenoylcysteine decarboxylase/phosphopantothenate--cysteine ligase